MALSNRHSCTATPRPPPSPTSRLVGRQPTASGDPAPLWPQAPGRGDPVQVRPAQQDLPLHRRPQKLAQTVLSQETPQVGRRHAQVGAGLVEREVFAVGALVHS